MPGVNSQFQKLIGFFLPTMRNIRVQRFMDTERHDWAVSRNRGRDCGKWSSRCLTTISVADLGIQPEPVFEHHDAEAPSLSEGTHPRASILSAAAEFRRCLWIRMNIRSPVDLPRIAKTYSWIDLAWKNAMAQDNMRPTRVRNGLELPVSKDIRGWAYL